ncbi:Zn-ribbon domain-containing OB-fold protein [Actinomadura sp. 1N219]
MPTPSEPFWKATAEGRLLLPRCEPCTTVIWYPRPFCPHCGGRNITWFQASGEATIYSYTVVRKARGEYRDLTPYVVAYVELAEGPKILTNIIACDPSKIKIGHPVTLTFDPPTPEDDTVSARLYRFHQTNTN